MNSTKTFYLAGLLALAAGLAQAQTPPRVFSDTFWTPKLDKFLWSRSTIFDASSQQNEGHLRIFSNPTNASLNQTAGVLANFTQKYNKGDTLALYGTVRIPHKIPSNPGGTVTNAYETGIGVFQSPTNFNFIVLMVRDSLSNRQFAVYSYSQSLGGKRTYLNYNAPTNISVYKLRMTYSCATDNIGFSWAPLTTNTWTKICPPLKMADLFGPAPTKFMRPVIMGFMENMRVPRDWNVWVDNFMAIYRDRPL
jgi:hypothetical protein